MIRIIGFSDVEIDGIHVGHATAAMNNYPQFTAELLAALDAYEAGLVAAAVPAPEVPVIDPAEIAELQGQIAELQQQVTQLQLELSPDIAAVTPALMAAGLLTWGERATMANSEAVLGLVLELRDIAMAPRSISQCDRIKDTFGTICGLSGVVPTPSEAQAMQAVLDAGSPSTGPIAAKHLSFKPWM